MLPPNLYARVRVPCAQLHARPRVRRAPGLPCALYFQEGRKLIANLGRNAPRDREVISNRHCLRQTRSVCARERSDEAIHPSASGKMDCFASLAMTSVDTMPPSSRWSSPGSTGRPSIPEAAVTEPRSRSVLDIPHTHGMMALLSQFRNGRAAASAPQRLQALEGQPLGIADAGQIELADEGGGRLAVAIGQRHDGIDRNSLGVDGLPRAVRGHKPRSVLGRRLIRR